MQRIIRNVAVAAYIRSLVIASSAEVIVVKDDESIQDAVVAASPGRSSWLCRERIKKLFS